MAAESLDSKIAHVAALRRCRFCGNAVVTEAVICECRIARGEIPHTEWERHVKRWLCVRAIERRLLTTEQELFEGLLGGNYHGTMRSDGVQQKVISFSAPVAQLYPYAVEDAAAWVADGCKTLYTI